MGQGAGTNTYMNQSLAQNTQQAGTQAGATYAGMTQGQGPLARTDLSPYMNPFTQNVVNTTMGEIGRQQQQQGLGIADQATKQGAFGGDRFAIQQAENDRNWNAQKSNTLAGLNQANFSQAQQAGQQDISNRLNAASGLGNMANMGFGWNNQIQQNQLQAGALQQAQQQQILDNIKSQYQGYTGQGMQGVNDFMKAIQGMGGNLMQSKGSSSGSSKSGSFGGA